MAHAFAHSSGNSFNIENKPINAGI